MLKLLSKYKNEEPITYSGKMLEYVINEYKDLKKKLKKVTVL
jgi:hypothetical protein